MQVLPDWGRELTFPVDEPVFFVEVWTPASTWSPANPAWQCEEIGLSQCDVHEAIAWAQERTPSEGCYVLHACFFDDRANGVMVWLAGHKPDFGGEGNSLTFTWPAD